jgi:hypothetical protein
MRIRTLASIALGIASICLLTTTGFAKPRPPQPPWPQATLQVFRFDSAYSRVPWRHVALNEDESTGAESWSGYALVREGMPAAPVVVPVRISETESNLAPACGTIRFWFAPQWSTASKAARGKGPGHLAHLLDLVNLEGKATDARWTLFLNESVDGDIPSAGGVPRWRLADVDAVLQRHEHAAVPGQ